MKKYLILFLAIILSGTIAGSKIIEVPEAEALGLTLMGGDGTSGGAGGGGEDSCSAESLLFSWYAENTTVTSGTPAGCSMGDEVGTANDSITLSSTQNRSDGGTNSAYVADGSKYYTFDGTDEDIFHVDAGSVTFYVYITTWVQTASFLQIYGDADNYIFFKMRNAGTVGNRDPGIIWKGQGATVYANPTATDIVLNAWCGIKFEWDISENPDWKVSFDLNDDGNFTNADSGNMDPTDLAAGSKASFELDVGEIGGYDAEYYIDDIKINDTETL